MRKVNKVRRIPEDDRLQDIRTRVYDAESMNRGALSARDDEAWYLLQKIDVLNSQIDARDKRLHDARKVKEALKAKLDKIRDIL